MPSCADVQVGLAGSMFVCLALLLLMMVSW